MTLMIGAKSPMVKALLLLATLLCLSTTVSSCSSAEKLPGVDVPLQQMNSQLRLSLPGGAEHLQVGDSIPLIIQDLAQDPVVFPQDFGAKLFVRQNQQWVPVENDVGYPAGEFVLLPVKQQPFGAISTFVDPVISQSPPVTVRAVVVGHLRHNGQTGQVVAAYLDITLQP